MARRKRLSPISTTGLDPSTSISIGPASTPQINHHPPLFQPEHLFPLLRPTASNAHLVEQRNRKRRSGGSEVEAWDWTQSPTATAVGATDDEHEEGEGEGEELFNRGMWAWGVGLVTFSSLCFVLGIWSIAVAPFVETEGILILDTLAKDMHYKYLLVFLVPVTLYAVIINWWGLKIFRHA